MSEYLEARGEPPPPMLADLFRRVDGELLTTYPEIDHFPQRRDGEYVGIWDHDNGEDPVWPLGDDPRVFAYLNFWPGIGTLLRKLAANRWPTLVFCSHPTAARASAGSLLVVRRPLRLVAVARDCEMVLIHAGYGTVARFLLAGVPLVMVPLQSEQYQLAGRVEKLGAGLRVKAEPATINKALERIRTNPGFAAAAREFAGRHGGPDNGERLAQVVMRLETLCR